MKLIARGLLIGVGGIGLLALALFHYKERDSYQCQFCFSEKHDFQWRLGSWGGNSFSVPLSPSWERLEETQFSRDFFQTNHAHVWRFVQGSPYYFFGTKWGGCAIGAGLHASQLFEAYEMDPDFRKFIQSKLQDRSLTRTNFIAMVSEPTSREGSAMQKDSDALINAFYKR